MGRCAAVCRFWSDIACAEHYWEDLVARRWCHKQPKRVTNGPLQADRSKFWKSMYKQWDRTSRQPSSSFSGDRFPAFAAYSPKKKPTRARRMLKEGVGGGGWEEGRPMRAGVWVTCRHDTSDCSVPKRDVCPCLAINITVQNFESHPITVWPGEVALKLKSGSSSRPLLHARSACAADNEANLPCPGILSLFRGGTEQIVEDGEWRGECGGGDAGGVTLAQWDFVVLGPYEFGMPLDVEFEPEALERCDAISVAFTREEAKGRCGGAKELYPKEVDRRLIRAKFDETMIWKHYADVNGKFWVFSDRPNNTAGI